MMRGMARDYEIRRNRRSKHLRLRVNPDGSVVVTAPYGVPKIMIDRFAKKSWGWVERQQRKIGLKKLANPVLDWDELLLSYLGKLYYIREADQVEKVVLGKKYIYVSPVTGLEKDVQPTLMRWLKQQGELFIRESVGKWSKKIGVEVMKLSFRQQKSRWGSCSSSGTLSFNWRLVHFSPEVIDYVVIHELAHTLEHNHSKEFWGVVKKFDPDYKRKVQFLKQQVIAIE